MGVFYNWKLVKTIPRSWNDIGQNNIGSSDAPTEEDASSSGDAPDYTDILLGIESRYIPSASDVVSLFFLQNNVSSYAKLSDQGAVKALDSYVSFSRKAPPVTLTRIGSTMKDLNLSTVDMFVRGKIGMVI